MPEECALFWLVHYARTMSRSSHEVGIGVGINGSLLALGDLLFAPRQQSTAPGLAPSKDLNTPCQASPTTWASGSAEAVASEVARSTVR